MKTYAICPISTKRIDENVARFNGLLTVLLLTSYVLTSSILVIAFLSVDFLLRSLELSKFSPIAIVSKKILSALAIKPALINAGPKVFAARIGFIFTFLIISSQLFGYETGTLIFTFIFGICAFLESAFGFCVACQIYPIVYKLIYQSKANNA